MANLIKTDIGYVVDETSTTPGDSAANQIGIYNTKDFVDFFPPDVTNVQDALFNAKLAAIQANEVATVALSTGIKKNANFLFHTDVDSQPSLSFVLESDMGAVLPLESKIVGVVLTITAPWDNLEHSSIVANVGFVGQLAGLASNVDLTVGNPNSNGTPFQAIGVMNWVMNPVAGLIPTIEIVAANNLTSIIAGGFSVDLFYATV
jgi:hypothetical protein